EVNPLTVEATPAGTIDDRSTFEDFLPELEDDAFDPFNIGYVRDRLGFNAMWLMPIFPQTRYRWSLETWQWVDNLSPGSPYATRDYWQVSHLLSAAKTEAAALDAFRKLCNDAAAIGLDVFLDVTFNHAGRDVVYG